MSAKFEAVLHAESVLLLNCLIKQESKAIKAVDNVSFDYHRNFGFSW
jgi:hypothetical protein